MSESEILITFPDGQKKSFPAGISLSEIAQSISPSLKKKSAAGKVNGDLYDLNRPIDEDARIELLSLASAEGIKLIRHSAAHLMAQALKRLHGHLHLGVGPVIENGFYYDVELDHTISQSDLEKIEKEMKTLIAENHPILRKEVSREEARDLFSKDPLKLELLEEIPSGEKITVYKQGEFIDLCRGPHLPSTGAIKHFKLTHVSGAYWRGDSNNKVLQRIYGVAFTSREEMEEYFHFQQKDGVQSMNISAENCMVLIP
ncbi:TGS domain-containing protein [Rossellomorea aquimaris]|uniref:threonine--tRNA ligase n=1 Tax=Rossellomorea aquimaris TaxID=189382 RepID=A0A5D4TY20_9BACI|nr:TGS domain-containing protein [Rossellomorea aquimaris]